MVQTVKSETYQVLARKYRPQKFSEVVGQSAMVRVIKNAFANDRLAHSFILFGVRGIGKTTTARLIAKGLNCIGSDGQGEPTTEPCCTCSNCIQIANGTHIDVLELDAASRTGVDDVREIIESVPYQAASARFKVYIIDEVHMLSRNAFNALLKTLEEPPPHVKFIFATTEIRKVPLTVLSRCQRFDLRRVEPDIMSEHLGNIANQENAKIDDDAMALIVRAAEGSLRDAISLLDQAISYCDGDIAAEPVRNMLALADRGRILDLVEHIMAGNTAKALEELAGQYRDGADPHTILHDVADSVHWLSVVKFSNNKTLSDPLLSPNEKSRGLELSQKLSLGTLARTWQMLLKAIEEFAYTPNAMLTAEMAIIRLTCISHAPTPEELVKQLNEKGSLLEDKNKTGIKTKTRSHSVIVEEKADNSLARDSVTSSSDMNQTEKKVRISNEEYLKHPLVKSVLSNFPNSEVRVVGK